MIENDEPLLAFETDRVLLRPPDFPDYVALRRLELVGPMAATWRFRGTTPSPEEYPSALWAGVVAQHLVVRKPDELPVGIWLCYGGDTRNGHASIAGAKFDPSDRNPHFVEGGILFVDIIFRSWPFRKLYVEVPGYSLPQFSGSAGWLLTEEAVLKERYFHADRYWDEHIFSLSRERWSEIAPRARSIASRLRA